MSSEEDRKTAETALKELAERIRRWQEDRGFTTSAMIRKFGSLGSDKTYGKILRGEFAEMDVERQLVNYRSVWALIEATGDAENAGEELYDDLAAVVQLRRAFVECAGEGGNGRFILVQGDTGSGKTSAAKKLMERYGARILFVELSPVAGDSPYNFMLLLLEAMGIVDAPKNAVGAFHKVVSELRQRRRCIVIDELHHAGPRILNTIKSLLNATPGEVVGLCMPTLWYRMEKGAYEECRQLTGNRLAERIRLDKLNRSDLRKILSRRLPKLKDREDAVGLLENAAQGRGNLAFVRDVIRRAAEMGEELTVADFAAAAKAEAASR